LYVADRCLDGFDHYEHLRTSGVVGHDQVSAVHEAMGHAAALSRYFWPSGVGPKQHASFKRLRQARAAKLRMAFGLTDESPLRDRSLRDALEHFDERLDVYLLTSDAGQYIPVPRVGDSTGLPNGVTHVFKLVDPDRQVFIILDTRFEFGNLRDEVQRIYSAAKVMTETGDRLPPDGAHE
jgi:hypothetical protein